MERKKTFKSLIKFWQNTNIKKKNSRNISKKIKSKPRSIPRNLSEKKQNNKQVPLQRKPSLSRKNQKAPSRQRLSKASRQRLSRASRQRLSRASRQRSPMKFNTKQIKIIDELLKTEQNFNNVMVLFKDICEHIFDKSEKEKYTFLYSVIEFSDSFFKELNNNLKKNTNIFESLTTCETLFKQLNTDLKTVKSIHPLLRPYLTKKFLDKENKSKEKKDTLKYDFMECSETKGLNSLVKLFNYKNIKIRNDGISSISISLIQRILKYPLLFSELKKNNNDENKLQLLENIIKATKELATTLDKKESNLSETEETINREFEIRDEYCRIINSKAEKCNNLNKLCKKDKKCNLPYCKKKKKKFHYKMSCQKRMQRYFCILQFKQLSKII